MSEYDITKQNNQSNDQNNGNELRNYKIVCVKLGLSMCIYFLCRLITGWIAAIFGNFTNTLGETTVSIMISVIVILFAYVIPLFLTAIIFKSFTVYKGRYRELYKKPKKLARALGTFPAVYGLSQGTALLTLLVMFLITRNLSGQSYIEELLRPTVIEAPTNIASLIGMVFMLVIIAPVFEEFWVRGIMYDALKPYGTGIAIIISSFLFGLMHGSLYMLFYTTAAGLALGYIRYATGSLLIVTILHAIINSISAGALLLSSLLLITNEENRLINTMYVIYLLVMLVLIIVGVVAFLSKIPAMRKYRIENAWTDIGPWKKTALFFASIPVIIMMVLAFNELSGHWLLNFIRS